MQHRYVAIWFRMLTTDHLVRRRPELKDLPFVLAAPERGRMVVNGASAQAQAAGIYAGMVVADGRALLPDLQVLDDQPGLAAKLLHALAEWSIRFTPVAALDEPDGLLLDATGCAHLWGGERPYLLDMHKRFTDLGYHVRIAMAGTAGAAWAVSRLGRDKPVIEPGHEQEALQPLHPAALRLEQATLERLEKLGFRDIGSILNIPRRTLRRRFGDGLLLRLDQALGLEHEVLQPVTPISPYTERLPCLEPIRTARGIEIALQRLLDALCHRLEKEGKGLRTALFKGYRIDGNVQQADIGTNRPSRNAGHLYRLLALKIPRLEPGLGFELFVLEAGRVEDIASDQGALWDTTGKGEEKGLAELLDKIAGRVGIKAIHRYLPDEHYWPERAVKEAQSLQEKPLTSWRADLPRPVHLLPQPEAIEVTVPLPDYPPMLFIYQGNLHQVKKADGPERIEQEWWLQQGHYRDYYMVEDEQGARYWLFRAGDYSDCDPQWFIHGFFA